MCECMVMPDSMNSNEQLNKAEQSDGRQYRRLFRGLIAAVLVVFTALAALYTETVQLVTCNPDIKSVADLKGKNVSIGSSGSGVYFNAMDFLAAYDMTEADINLSEKHLSLHKNGSFHPRKPSKTPVGT